MKKTENLSKNIKKIASVLKKMYPHAQCELHFSSPLDLLVAVMLSAQATDVSVNKVTPNLFQKYKTALDYANAPIASLEKHIKSIGLYRTKAKNLKKMADLLVEKHGARVPKDKESLEALPGVGRKTANVVRSVAFGYPEFAVDTHVARIAWRLGLTKKNDTPLSIEGTLTQLFPKKEWSITHHRMIFFGRYFCTARNPKCNACPFQSMCRYFTPKPL